MEKPSHLDDLASKKWDELQEKVSNLSDSTSDAFSLLCISWSIYLKALKDIQETGINIDGSAVNGRRFVNPSINTMNESWKQILKLSKLFGLVPDAPSKESKASKEYKDMEDLVDAEE